MSENTRHDPAALAKAVLSDPAMDQALTWLIELETATQEQHQAFNAWIAADPANRNAFDRAQAIWNSQSVRDAASSL
jgi:transmembrane sensor